jgi:mono/diheme cytochrome c family protein
MKLTIIFAASLLFTSCGTSTPTNNSVGTNEKPAVSGPTVADIAAAGRKLYNQNCAACHRPSGKGGKMEFEGKTIDPEDLTSEKMKKMADDKMYGYIVDGLPDEGMPAFKEKLKEAEVREVVKYIRTELQKLP